jgi:predicted enzyme related to lactoylglutathione lyase
MPRIVHFEIPADSLDRAEKFYTDVFDWKIQKWEGGQMDYRLATTGDKEEMGINGAIMARGQESCIIDTIGVSNVDDYMKRIESHGGKMLTARTPIPGTGYVAYFQDTEGNKLGIFQPDMSAK